MSGAVDDNASNVAVNEPQLLAAMFNGDANAFGVQTANGQAKADVANIIASGLAIHMSVGSADALLSDNQLLDALLTSLGIPHDPLEVIPRGIHDPRTIFDIIGPTPFQFINAHFLDTPPAVTVSNLIATHGQSFASSSLFTASDPDGDAIAQYDFWNAGTGGGHFLVNGQALGAKQDNYVSAAQLAQSTYVSGSGADTLWVRVSDGPQWSPWSQGFTVTAPVDTGPVVTSVSNIQTTAGQTFAASSLFTASDPFGDATAQYDFWNTGAGGGHFLLNNQTLGTNQDNYVSSAQLAQTTYVSGSGADTLWVRVNEGGQWSPWSQSFTVSDPTTIGAGETLELASAFSGQVSFAAPTGILKLLNSESFAGTVAGMSGQDAIDFADINPTEVQQPTYSGTSAGGTLTVTDGTHSANIALLGNYIASTFVASSDGHGGTNIVDPQQTSANQQMVLTQPQHA